ncbi:PepSY domain-containing protein [Psychrobacter sp. DAB_AL43B]|uniref:PepSY domain-containing protein n=1 Tax=Psychrobacter sp. DAB_AL43B TaxID=1028416 RepID=UPI0009A5EE91|nr:PepSY domain-containing protein [Psychrobacter sp. DAB_AL43B]SLJ84689.1 peptidase [Psychrobacter sp. DAB_AL43B]
MKKLSMLSKSAIVVVSALVIGTGIGTIAIASGQIPAISGAETSDAVAIAKSKISLEQAIVMAQKTVKGDLISAEFDQNDYMAGDEFEVKFIDGDMEHEVKIDASSGKILKTKQEKLDAEDLAEYKALKQAKISLTQAMQKATQSDNGKMNGKIIEAEFDFDNGIPAYEIEMAKGVEIHKLVIDSINGQVISSQLDYDD